jgi:hypothetical protein
MIFNCDATAWCDDTVNHIFHYPIASWSFTYNWHITVQIVNNVCHNYKSIHNDFRTCMYIGGSFSEKKSLHELQSEVRQLKLQLKVSNHIGIPYYTAAEYLLMLTTEC